MTRSIFLLLILSLLQQVGVPASTEPLQGSVKVDEHLLDKSVPPLDPTLAPGNTFDKDAATALLRKEIPQNVWFKVPVWLAGNWEIKEATQIYARDEITHREDKSFYPKMNVTKGGFGLFPTSDRNFWWQFADSTYWTETEGQDYISWFFHQYIEPVNVNSENFSAKDVSVEFRIDKNSNKIIEVCQRQDLFTYTKTTDDLIQQTDYAREYGFSGKPIRSFRLISNDKRTSMACISIGITRSGRNAIELILAYLQDRNMQNEYDNIIRITQNPTGDHLAPLDSALAPGNTFNQDTATALLKKTPENDWIKAPIWCAGTWLPQEIIVTHIKNEITGQEDNNPKTQKVDTEKMISATRENAQLTFGYLPAKGAWWQYADSGSWKKTEEADHLVYTFEQQKNYVEGNDETDTVTVNGISIIFIVDPNDNKIRSVMQQVSTSTATRIANDQIKAVKDSKNYTYTGGLIGTTDTIFFLKKVEEPVLRARTRAGDDAVKLLFTFLLAHKMADEARTVIDTMREKQMYTEADNAKKILEAMLSSSTSRHQDKGT